MSGTPNALALLWTSKAPLDWIRKNEGRFVRAGNVLERIPIHDVNVFYAFLF